MRAGVALGSNLGNRLGNLREARAKIEAFCDAPASALASAIYETDPVGCEAGAPKFLNAVLDFECARDPHDLVRELIQIEESLGRSADHAKNSSRTIDLDLLYFGDVEIQTSELALPHPRIAQRKFVLQPLADIRPDLILPGKDETVSALLAQLVEGPAVVRSPTQW